MLEHLLEGVFRTGLFGGFFLQNELLCLQVFDAALIGRHDRWRACFDDAVEQLGDLFFDLAGFGAKRGFRAFHLGKPVTPDVAEHEARDFNQTFGRLEAAQQGLELRLHLVA